MKEIVFTLQLVIIFLALYNTIISIWGIKKTKKTIYLEEKNKFVILIPAHNEENVIGELLKSLNNLDYPKELYEIFVIADNCSDNTVNIAKAFSSNIIINNSKYGEPKGKPYAIQYAISNLGNKLLDYDGAIIFDADNIVDKLFLKEINNKLLEGEKIIQGYLDTKNVNDNFISLGYAASYYFMNRSWQLSKSRIGLSSIIGGTGFCVETRLLKDIGWSATSITEDLEFSMQCILRNEKISWAHNAKIYDEKPLKLGVTIIQRLRWMRGHWDVCFKYAPKLLNKSIKHLDLVAFDAFLSLIHPGRFLVTIGVPLFTLISFINIYFKESYIIPWPIWLFLTLYNLIYMFITFYDSEDDISGLRAFLSLVMINYLTLPILVYSLLTKNNKTWVRTEHNRNIKINERGN